MLVEQQGARLALLDPADLRVQERWTAPQPLRGAPQFTPDGRHAFVAAAGGRIVKLQLAPLAAVGEARTGDEVTGLALSGDGRWLLAATAAPALELFDAALQRQQRWPAARLNGTGASPVAQVRDVPERRGFVVSFAQLAELWQISYDPAAEPIFDGLVHDYRMGEGIARDGFLGVRRAPLDAPLRLLAVGGRGRHALGIGTTGAGTALDLVHLDVRRRIARTELGAAAVVDATLFTRAQGELLAVGLAAGGLRVVDAAAGRILRALDLGAVAYVRTHPAARQLWVGLQGPPARIALVDKEALAVDTLLQVQGELQAPPAFTPAGDRVLVPVRDGEADALLVFDAQQPGTAQRIATGAAPRVWSSAP